MILFSHWRVDFKKQRFYLLRTLLRQPDQFREYRRSETRHRIPALRYRKPGSIAASADTLRDVGKRLIALLVQPRVQESEGCLAICNQGVVCESDDGGHEGAGGAGPGDDFKGWVPDDLEVEALRWDVGVGTTIWREEC